MTDRLKPNTLKLTDLRRLDDGKEACVLIRYRKLNVWTTTGVEPGDATHYEVEVWPCKTVARAVVGYATEQDTGMVGIVGEWPGVKRSLRAFRCGNGYLSTYTTELLTYLLALALECDEAAEPEGWGERRRFAAERHTPHYIDGVEAPDQ